jgi:hypothetical protein
MLGRLWCLILIAWHQGFLPVQMPAFMGLRLIGSSLSLAWMNQDALKLDLEYITQARPLPANETFSQVLGRVDEVARQADLPDRLQHYLSQRSYVKALVWLDNPDSPHHL